MPSHVRTTSAVSLAAMLLIFLCEISTSMADVLDVDACVTKPLAESALGASALQRLHEEKSYQVLNTALPRKSFGGHGKNIEVGRTKGPATLQTHQTLKGSEVTRKEIAAALEPIIPYEFGNGKCKHGFPCDVGWKDVRKRQNRIMYVSSLIDLQPFQRRVYIDGGSRGYDSSIDGWFNPGYPQAPSFDAIYGFEISQKFGKTFEGKENSTFLPCAIWTKDEELPMFGKNMNTLSSKSHMSYIRSPVVAHAMDFSNWLHQNVSPEDFVVIKLDIEGAEHEVLQYLLETKAIYLLDEIFVECHFNRWSKMRMDKTRADCVSLMQGLRDRGLLLHEWF